MHDDVPGACDGFVCTADQMLAGGRQHLKHDVVWHEAVVDDVAHEVKVSLTGGRESDLDLLVAHLHQQGEHRQFTIGIHRVDERLITVAQVDRTPSRGVCDALGRPRAVGQVDRDERRVATDRQRRRGLAREGHTRSEYRSPTAGDMSNPW
jgi:hypothetical protein